MKDNLKDFVQNNRAAFDDEAPRAHIWKGISRNLPAAKRSFMWVWQAAAVIFFATSVLLLADRSGVVSPQEIASEDSFNQVEDFYFREINQKRAFIQDISETGVSAEAELQKLDAMYLVLKEQFRENPSEEVLEALTLNLIVRLDLLNQVVAEIEKAETEKASEKPGAQAEI